MSRKELLLQEQRWLQLAGDLLTEAGEHYSNHGCNDWEFPKDWTQAECNAFAKAFCDWDDPERYKPGMSLPDYSVMNFLGDWLRNLEAE